MFISTPKSGGSKRLVGLVEPLKTRRRYNDWPTNSRDLSCTKKKQANIGEPKSKSVGLIKVSCHVQNQLVSKSFGIYWGVLNMGTPNHLFFPVDNKQFWMILGYPYFGQTHVCVYAKKNWTSPLKVGINLQKNVASIIQSGVGSWVNMGMSKMKSAWNRTRLEFGGMVKNISDWVSWIGFIHTSEAFRTAQRGKRLCNALKLTNLTWIPLTSSAAPLDNYP